MVRAASRGLSKGGHYWEAEDAERGVCGRRRLPKAACAGRRRRPESGVCRKAEATGSLLLPEDAVSWKARSA